MTTPAPPDVRLLVQNTVQANKDHQYALRVYSERLEAELEVVDKLLTAADVPEDEPDVDVGGHITVPGAVRAAGPVPPDIAPADHPFADEAARRQKYMRCTVVHPMKVADLEALADAVRAENHRVYALEAQARGQQPFVGLNQHPQSYFELNKEGINWERVASKVTAAGVHSVQRTAEECRIRWLGDRHPEIDHGVWSATDIARVKELVGKAKEGEVDWVDIAAKLGTRRTPVDCMRHAIARKPHVFTNETDARLIEAVKKYGIENWLLVARHVSEDATAAQCQSRWARTLDPDIKHGVWTPEEDDQLRRAVDVFDRSWVDICTFVPGRNNDQCRDRWQDALNPTLNKTKWSEKEDEILLVAVAELGQGNWKAVSRRTVGRTDNMCRHRYALLSKKLGAHTESPGPADVGASTPAPEEEQPVAGPSQLPEPIEPTTESLPKRKRKSRARPKPAPVTQNLATDDPTANVPSAEATEETQTAIPDKPKPKPRARSRKKATSDEGADTLETTLEEVEAVEDVLPAGAKRNKRARPEGQSAPPPPKRKRAGRGQQETQVQVESAPPVDESAPPVEKPANASEPATVTTPKRGKKVRPPPPPPTRQSARLRDTKPI